MQEIKKPPICIRHLQLHLASYFQLRTVSVYQILAKLLGRLLTHQAGGVWIFLQSGSLGKTRFFSTLKMTSYLILLFLNLAGFVLFEVLHPHFLSVLLKLISAMSQRKIIQNGFCKAKKKKILVPQEPLQGLILFELSLPCCSTQKKATYPLLIIEQTCLLRKPARIASRLGHFHSQK